jgi:DNA mismatch repair ATPase MutL
VLHGQIDSTEYVPSQDDGPISVHVKGFVSKFAVGCGRTGTDRQFFYVNGRPCNLHAVRLLSVGRHKLE